MAIVFMRVLLVGVAYDGVLGQDVRHMYGFLTTTVVVRISLIIKFKSIIKVHVLVQRIFGRLSGTYYHFPLPR